MTSRLKTLLVGAGILLTSAMALTSFGGTVSAAVDNDPDCDTVAIIKCGAFTATALREKAAQGDVPRVYRAFDISQADLEGTFVKGIVWRDGRVTVDGETVATGAMTAGRNYGGTPIPNTNGAGVYPTSKFVDEGQTAFVRMVNGTFDFAVIKSCGNPVTATPKPKPEPPQPKFECVSLKVSEVSRTKRTFTVKATASDGAKIVNYEYGFGDGMGATYTGTVYPYEYKTPGTYNASVVVNVMVNGTTKKVTSAACKVPVTILGETVVTPKPEPCPYDATLPKNSPNCKPPVTPVEMCPIVNKTHFPKDSVYCREDSVTPVTAPTEIIKTGPEAFAMGGLGLGSLTAAGYYWGDSRRKLLAKFLNRQ